MTTTRWTVEQLEQLVVGSGFEISVDARPTKWTVRLQHKEKPVRFAGESEQPVYGQLTNELMYERALRQAAAMMAEWSARRK